MILLHFRPLLSVVGSGHIFRSSTTLWLIVRNETAADPPPPRPQPPVSRKPRELIVSLASLDQTSLRAVC